jgi:hypothetical protein
MEDNNDSKDNDDSLDEDDSMDEDDIDQEMAQLNYNIWELDKKYLLVERPIN